MKQAREAEIIINGVRLNYAQSMTLRVAIGDFLHFAQDEGLGEIGPLYLKRAMEILELISGITGEKSVQQQSFCGEKNG